MSEPEIEHRIREQAIPTQNTPTGAWAIMVPVPLFHEAVAELERLRSKPQDWQAGFAAGKEAAASRIEEARPHWVDEDVDGAIACDHLAQVIRAIAVPQEPT